MKSRRRVNSTVRPPETRRFTSDARRKALDSVALQFDRFRPGYPPKLIDTILNSAGLSAEAHILEIGCGTGRSAVPFAKRGYRITCLEPGRKLATVAKRNLARYASVRVKVCKFEDWASSDESVDLILAPQSFHLVDGRVRIPKAARILKQGCSLAVFGNEPTRGTSVADDLIHEAYLAFAPRAEQGWRPETLTTRGKFAIRTFEFEWTHTYTAQDYVGLMKTRTPIMLRISEAKRLNLLSAISRAIKQQVSLTVTYISHLCLATRLAA